MSKTLQGLIIFSVISLSGLLALISVQRSLCVRSSVVDLIEDSSGQIYLFSCISFALQPLAPEHPSQRDLPQRLKRSVEKLEWLTHLLPRPSQPLRVKVSDAEPFLFQSTHDGPVLGSIWVNHETSFLRAIIHVWLVSVYPELEREPLSLGVWTLYLLAHLQGRYQVEAWDGQILRGSDVTYSRMAVSLKEYCLSPFKSLGHFDACMGLQDKSWTEDKKSLWPLVHLRALKLYKEHATLEAIQTQTARLAQGDFGVVGREQDGSIKDVEFVLREEALSPFMREGLGTLDDPVLLESDHGRYWVSKWGKVAMVGSGQMTVADPNPVRVWMGCEAPRWERLLGQIQGDWLWMPVCSGEIDVSQLIADFQRQGLRRGLAANKNVPFVWISGQGLRVIARLGFDVRKSKKKKFDLIGARRFEFWQNDIWDSAFKAFRPRSAIPLVRWHRANQNILGIN